MATIYIIKGPNDGDAFTVGDHEVVIGRGEDCSITLDDHKASRQHIKISYDSVAGGHVAEDLRSTNGTWRNGKSMTTAAVLINGDELEFGESAIEYSSQTFDSNEAAQAARKNSKPPQAPHTILDESNKPF